MVDICLDEPSLFLRCGIAFVAAGEWPLGVMIVICPFSEVVGKLQTGHIGRCILKVDDDQLLMLVGSL